MIDLGMLTLFIPASLLLIIAPGPDILFVVAQGVSAGKRAGFFTALGLALRELRPHSGGCSRGIADL